MGMYKELKGIDYVCCHLVSEELVSVLDMNSPKGNEWANEAYGNLKLYLRNGWTDKLYLMTKDKMKQYPLWNFTIEKLKTQIRMEQIEYLEDNASLVINSHQYEATGSFAKDLGYLQDLLDEVNALNDITADEIFYNTVNATVMKRNDGYDYGSISLGHVESTGDWRKTNVKWFYTGNICGCINKILYLIDDIKEKQEADT
jgi:hypothetical protein